MRIAHVTATFPPYHGGAGTIVWEQTRRLAARGHDVTVITARPRAELGPIPASPRGVEVVRDRPVVALGNAPLLPRLARLRGWDVVHLHYPFIFGAEMLLASRVRPLVVSYNNQLVGSGTKGALFEGYEATVAPRVIARAAQVHVLSHAHATSVPYLARLAAPKLVEVPAGVDLDRFSPGPPDPAVRASLGIPAGAPVAVVVAALDRAHAFKRIDLALAALTHLEDLRLIVVGGGEDLEMHRAEAGRLGVAGRVTFAGYAPHERLPELLRAGDILTLYSDPPESFGIVLAEAMASGRPILVSDLPGPRHLVREGETGFVVPGGDGARLAATLAEFFALTREQRAAMGAAARADVERRFGWESVVDRVEASYRFVAA